MTSTALISVITLLHILATDVYAVPATIDTAFAHRLTNSYTGPGKSLAATADGSGNLQMANTSDTPLQYWNFVLLETGPKYALRTVYFGDYSSLDVINDQGVNSNIVHLSATGSYSGQYWTVTAWGDGTLYLTNDFTGPTKHLDVYSDTFQPMLSLGDYTGQHWTITKVENTTNISSTVSASAASSSSTNAPTTNTEVTSGGLSTGAKAGISVGAALAGAFFVAGGIWLYRKRGKELTSDNASPRLRRYTPPSRSEVEAGGEQDGRVQGFRYPGETYPEIAGGGTGRMS